MAVKHKGSFAPRRLRNRLGRTIERREFVLLVSICSVVVLVGPPGRASEASAPNAFTMEGECVESLLAVPADTEKIRPLLPPGFEAQEVGGRSVVQAFAEDCTISIAGNKSFSMTASGTVVRLSRPAGVYDLTWNGDAREYFRAYNRLGIGTFVEGSSYEAVSSVPGIVRSEALIPGDFSFTADSVEASSADRALLEGFASEHWGYGRFGAVLGTYLHDFTALGASQGILRAEPGSPLAQIIGTDPVQTVGIHGAFRFTGLVEVVGDPQ